MDGNTGQPETVTWQLSSRSNLGLAHVLSSKNGLLQESQDNPMRTEPTREVLPGPLGSCVTLNVSPILGSVTGTKAKLRPSVPQLPLGSDWGRKIFRAVKKTGNYCFRFSWRTDEAERGDGRLQPQHAGD